MGDHAGYLALSWWALEKTGSANTIGILLGFGFLVRVVSLNFTGPMGDRFCRRKILYQTNLFQALLTAALAMLAYKEVFDLFLILPILGLKSFCSALNSACAGAFVTELVPKEKISDAIRSWQGLNATAGIIGALAGGVWVTNFGIVEGFSLDALTFALSSLLVAAISYRPAPKTKMSRWTMKSYWSDLSKGWSKLRSNTPVFQLTFVLLFVNFALAPLVVIMPVLAKNMPSGDPTNLGIIQACVAIGSVVGSLVYKSLAKAARISILVPLALLSVCVAMFFLGVLGELYPIGSLLLIAGLGVTITNIAINARITLAIPKTHLSRVLSSSAFIVQLSTPVSVVLTGVLLDRLGLPMTMLALAIVLTLASLSLFRPRLASFLDGRPFAS